MKPGFSRVLSCSGIFFKKKGLTYSAEYVVIITPTGGNPSRPCKVSHPKGGLKKSTVKGVMPMGKRLFQYIIAVLIAIALAVLFPIKAK